MTSEPTCDAKIRPFPNDTEIQCEDKPDHGPDHGGTVHDYAYPGSSTVISWDEDDRRTFRGEFVLCAQQGCVLPWLHWGDHAQ